MASDQVSPQSTEDRALAAPPPRTQSAVAMAVGGTAPTLKRIHLGVKLNRELLISMCATFCLIHFV